MTDTLDAVGRAQQEILNRLRQDETPVSPQEVTKSVAKLGFDQSSIVSAMWFLIDRHVIELTSDLKLLPVK